MADDEALRTPEGQSDSNVIGSRLTIDDTEVGIQPDPPMHAMGLQRQRLPIHAMGLQRHYLEARLRGYWYLHMLPDDVEAGNGRRSELNIRTLWNLENTTRNKDEEVDKPFSPGKSMKTTTQRVLSFFIATIAFLWILTDVCNLLSIIKLQSEHGPLFNWFSLLEPVGAVVFVYAVAAMIMISAPLSRLLNVILLFWSTWMLFRSTKSLTALWLPILGILLMLVEKQLPNEV